MAICWQIMAPFALKFSLVYSHPIYEIGQIWALWIGKIPMWTTGEGIWITLDSQIHDVKYLFITSKCSWQSSKILLKFVLIIYDDSLDVYLIIVNCQNKLWNFATNIPNLPINIHIESYFKKKLWKLRVIVWAENSNTT